MSQGKTMSSHTVGMYVSDGTPKAHLRLRLAGIDYGHEEGIYV